MRGGLVTAGDIAKALGIHPDYCRKIVRLAGARPVGLSGMTRLYAPDAVEQVRAYIKRHAGGEQLHTLAEIVRSHGIPAWKAYQWRREGRLISRGRRGSLLLYADADVLALAQAERDAAKGREKAQSCRACAYCKLAWGWCVWWDTWVNIDDTCGYWVEDSWRALRKAKKPA